MNFQDKNFKEVLYFVTKALFISAIFIFTYHLTIGVAIKKIDNITGKIDNITEVAIKKIDNITDVIYSLQDRVEGIDNFIAKMGIDNINSNNKLSESERNRIRNNTKKLLENLSPVIDEILLYDFNQTSVQHNE